MSKERNVLAALHMMESGNAAALVLANEGFKDEADFAEAVLAHIGGWRKAFHRATGTESIEEAFARETSTPSAGASSTDELMREVQALFASVDWSDREAADNVQHRALCMVEQRASQLERELAEVRHDLERAMANHNADLNALPSATATTCQHFALTAEAVQTLADWMNDGDGGVQEVTLHVDADGELSVSLPEYPEEGAAKLVVASDSRAADR